MIASGYHLFMQTALLAARFIDEKSKRGVVAKEWYYLALFAFEIAMYWQEYENRDVDSGLSVFYPTIDD